MFRHSICFVLLFLSAPAWTAAGWGLRTLEGHRKVFHSGSNGSGFRCYSEFFPDTGDGLVSMTNSLAGDDLWNDVVDQWHTFPVTQP